MARCSDCNKFVSYGDPSAEITANIDNSVVVAYIRIALTCENCGTELRDATFDFEQDTEHKCTTTPIDGEQYEIVSADADGYSDGKTHGANITIKVRCNWCRRVRTIRDTVSGASSEFEDL